MSAAGTEIFDFAPFSPAVFSKSPGNPILNWHHRTAKSAGATDNLDTLIPSLPGSPVLYNLPDEIPSRPSSRAGSDVDDIVPSRSYSSPPCGLLPQLALSSLQFSTTYEAILNNPRVSVMDSLQIPDETTFNPTLLDCAMQELNAITPERLQKLESAIFDLKDPDIDKEPRNFAQRVLSFLLKDVSNTGPFYLLSANNALYVLITIYPATRYAEVRANIVFNIGCAGIHYLSGCLKYDILNRKDFKKGRLMTYVLFAMILAHLARACYQYTMLSETDWQEPWPKDHSMFNEANRIRFAAAGWTFLEIVFLEIWYASVPLIR